MAVDTMAPPRVVVIGDTQRTSRLEFVFRPHDAAQDRLFEVLADERMDALFHVGDLVTWGPSRRHWARFDRLHAPLHRRAVPIWPVLGNHDYMPLAGPGARAVDARFPHVAGKRWWTTTVSGVAFIGLDSNFGPLGQRARRAQRAFLERTIARHDADPDVRAVVGLWHHPPMTNSWVVAPCPVVRREFVAPLAASPKAIAAFCGHCHGFEHFREGGLDLFVSGGGGGPLQPLRRGRLQRAKDRFSWPSATRFLHFCTVDVLETTIRLRVVRVDAGVGPDEVYRVDLPYPPSL